MSELVSQFPGAQRALFRSHHVGGCSSCGFKPGETLAEVCSRNENLPVEAVVQTILSAHDEDQRMQVSPGEAAELEQIVARKDVAAFAGEKFATFPVFANGARGGQLRRGVPGPGEHGREILVELKFDDAEIADMKRAGAVK